MDTAEKLAGVSKNARKLYARLCAGQYYKAYDARTPKAMQELEAAKLVGTIGRYPLVISCYVPIGTTSEHRETFPDCPSDEAVEAAAKRRKAG